MKIRDILAGGQPTLSFEVFPPKVEADYDSVEAAAFEIARLKPAFMSVTYGAGGGTSRYTVGIAADLQNQCGVNALAHLTCVSSTRERVREELAAMKELGIENVLALRGDIPEGGTAGLRLPLRVGTDPGYQALCAGSLHRSRLLSGGPCGISQ